MNTTDQLVAKTKAADEAALARSTSHPIGFHGATVTNPFTVARTVKAQDGPCGFGFAGDGVIGSNRPPERSRFAPEPVTEVELQAAFLAARGHGVILQDNVLAAIIRAAREAK